MYPRSSMVPFRMMMAVGFSSPVALLNTFTANVSFLSKGSCV